MRVAISEHSVPRVLNRSAFEYSAEGLEPVSVEGALARTQGRLL